MRFFLRLVSFLLLLGIILAVAVSWLGYQIMVPMDPSADAKPIYFQVASGSSGAEVTHELALEHLIRFETPFRLMMRYGPQGGELRAGYFRLSPHDPPFEILRHLLRDKPVTHRATLAEGLIASQVADVLVKAEVLTDAKPFLEQVHGHGKSYGEIFPDDLEGYLYPETYDFPWVCSPEQALTRMTGLFRERVLPEWEKNRSRSPLKTLREVIILASLVEREAQRNAERGLIAGVYINRLRASMPLQCDATIQFALGKQHAVVSYDDLKIDSPYNTYLHAGLPPGPIANPGLACIVAAMKPTPSDFLFYVRDDKKNDGSHLFSRTYGEHLKISGEVQR